MAICHSQWPGGASVPGLRWLNCLQPYDRLNDAHPGVVRFQVILDQMPGGTQCRLEIGLMTVPLHELVRRAPDVSIRKHFVQTKLGEV